MVPRSALLPTMGQPRTNSEPKLARSPTKCAKRIREIAPIRSRSRSNDWLIERLEDKGHSAMSRMPFVLLTTAHTEGGWQTAAPPQHNRRACPRPSRTTVHGSKMQTDHSVVARWL